MKQNDLCSAILNCDIEKIKNLVSSGVDVNQKIINRLAPLHLAAKNNLMDVAKLLISYKADLNCLGTDNFTPLQYAISKNHFELVQLLVEAGADLHLPSINGNSPLWTAVMNFRGDDRIVKYLLDKGADPFAPNKHGVTLFKLLDMPRNKALAPLFEEY